MPKDCIVYSVNNSILLPSLECNVASNNKSSFYNCIAVNPKKQMQKANGIRQSNGKIFLITSQASSEINRQCGRQYRKKWPLGRCTLEIK
jgi:hypothetical protein